MSLKKFKITYGDILDIANSIMDNPILVKPGLLIQYKLDPENHRRLNEELYFRTKGHENGLELEYYDVIELTVLDIDFKFIIDSDENNTL